MLSEVSSLQNPLDEEQPHEMQEPPEDHEGLFVAEESLQVQEPLEEHDLFEIQGLFVAQESLEVQEPLEEHEPFEVQEPFQKQEPLVGQKPNNRASQEEQLPRKMKSVPTVSIVLASASYLQV